MSDALPLVYLARHGETAWSISGQHTGLTDLPLTARGEQNAKNLGKLLQEIAFARVLTSPLQRARRTCELAGFLPSAPSFLPSAPGFLPSAEVHPLLVEWNYGAYEGRTTADIHREQPDWQIFRDGCPAGESVAEIAARADRVIAHLREAPAQLGQPPAPVGQLPARLGQPPARAGQPPAGSRETPGATLVFSSAHFLRVLAARWLGLDASCGRLLVLGTASLSILGYEHTLDEPVIRRWNDESAARM